MSSGMTVRLRALGHRSGSVPGSTGRDEIGEQRIEPKDRYEDGAHRFLIVAGQYMVGCGLMRRVRFLFWMAIAGLTFGQQATPPRAPTPPWSKAELDAIPIAPPRPGRSVTKTLFDGKTLDGWKGNLDWWSVRDGAIVGKFDSKVPTSFLFTNDKYSDFRLTLMSKMVESDNHAGVCFWGEIAQQGDNKWYTHGPLVIFPNPSMWDYNDAKGLRVYKPTTEKVTSQHEWVKVEILAQGNRVRAAFNGVAVLEWREANADRIREGPIGIQLHAWAGPQEAVYKDIVVETFPAEDRLITVGR